MMLLGGICFRCGHIFSVFISNFSLFFQIKLSNICKTSMAAIVAAVELLIIFLEHAMSFQKWSPDELKEAVKAYNQMRDLEISGKNLLKPKLSVA